MTSENRYRAVAIACALLGVQIAGTFVWYAAFEREGLVLPVALLALAVAGGALRTAWVGWRGSPSTARWLLGTLGLLTLTYAVVAATEGVPRWWLGLPWFALLGFVGHRMLRGPLDS